MGDISLIQHMPKLCEVYLSGCPISDYRVLIACENLKTLHVYQDQLPYDIKVELEKKGISIMLEMPN